MHTIEKYLKNVNINLCLGWKHWLGEVTLCNKLLSFTYLKKRKSSHYKIEATP